MCDAPVILSNGRKTHRGVINGLSSAPRLSRAVDRDLDTIEMPERGVVLSRALADELNIAADEILTVEVREGRRPVLAIPVVGIAESLLGAPAYMRLEALDRALRESRRVSGAHLRVDSRDAAAIYRRLENMPAVAGVSLKRDARDAFGKLMNTGAGTLRYVMVLIAAIITFGTVYNSTCMAYAERERDLASLRVIGFTRGEVGFVLLGELTVMVLVALPIGAVLGHFLTFGIARVSSADLYQIPVTFTPASHGLAAIAVILASIASGALVKRDADRAELVSALKSRE